jgi:hypothetical protein
MDRLAEFKEMSRHGTLTCYACDGFLTAASEYYRQDGTHVACAFKHVTGEKQCETSKISRIVAQVALRKLAFRCRIVCRLCKQLCLDQATSKGATEERGYRGYDVVVKRNGFVECAVESIGDTAKGTRYTMSKRRIDGHVVPVCGVPAHTAIDAIKHARATVTLLSDSCKRCQRRKREREVHERATPTCNDPLMHVPFIPNPFA